MKTTEKNKDKTISIRVKLPSTIATLGITILLLLKIELFQKDSRNSSQS